MRIFFFVGILAVSEPIWAGETVMPVNDGSGIISTLVGNNDPCTPAAKRCEKMSDNSDPTQFMQQLADASFKEGAQVENTLGMCARGVSYALTEACSGYKQGICGNATGIGKCLMKMGFQHCKFDSTNETEMQKLKVIGAIYVYVGGPAGNGHVEVYTGKSPKPWCSDHCTEQPMSAIKPPTEIQQRRPFGVYVPDSYKPDPKSGMVCSKDKNEVFTKSGHQ